MTLIKPFSYWEQKDVIQPAATLPQLANVLLRFENPLVNSTSTIWTDTSGLGYTTGRIEGTPAPTIDASNGVYLNNSGTTRTARFRVTTNTNIAIKSLAIIFNMPYAQFGGTGTNRNYFWDMRKSSATGNGGYLNQYDSIDGSSAAIYYNGTYYSYNDSTKIADGPLASTPVNITNGGNNTYGGTQSYQWLGPNGRAVYTTKRLWFFNFNPSLPLNLTTTAVRGLVFGTNDGLTEGGSLGIYSVIGWNTTLTASEFTQLINYYKGVGTLAP